MADPRYEYQRVNAVKVIIQSKKSGKILLLQEPETNEWMPLHWGLPGGKPLMKESLEEAFTRKMQEELSIQLEPHGILAIEQLLIEGRTVFMYILHSYVESENNIKKEGNYKWVQSDDVKSMSNREFTEYYSKRLLADFFEGRLRSIPIGLIRTENYYLLEDDSDYRDWLSSGKTSERK